MSITFDRLETNYFDQGWREAIRIALNRAALLGLATEDGDAIDRSKLVAIDLWLSGIVLNALGENPHPKAIDLERTLDWLSLGPQDLTVAEFVASFRTAAH